MSGSSQLRLSLLLVAIAVATPFALACTNGDSTCTYCNAGYWGAGCANPCTCKKGTCNTNASSTTGKCIAGTCNTGYTGDNCDTCLNGRYGASCDHVCTCVFGTCLDGMSGNGYCLPGTCERGFYGKNCDKSKKPTRTQTMTIVRNTTRPNTTTPRPPNTTLMMTTTLAPVVAGAIVLRLVYAFTNYSATNATQAIATVVGVSQANVQWSSVVGQSNAAAVSFTGTGGTANDTSSRDALNAKLVDAVKSGDSRLAFLGITSYSLSSTVPPTAPVTLTPAPTLPDESGTVNDGGAMSTTTLAIIAIVVVVVVIFGLVFAWFRYKHHLKQKQAVSEANDLEERRRREDRDRVIRGERPLYSGTNGAAGGAANGGGGVGGGSDDDDDDNPRLRIGSRKQQTDDERRVQFALPKSSIPAEPEPGAKYAATSGGGGDDDDGRFSPTGSEDNGPDDLMKLEAMVSGYEMKPVAATQRNVNPQAAASSDEDSDDAK